ncbi:hypothetical protein EYF80_035716 [Liparis tanakae]|uniref:Uncharacterized protein n=1 Tax=Liparis tanakae TaxID=230148 RepID=A0A4Z2GLF1_9TELE|nr:hypothetical protein EYF80_035716 [Liparis tanakae]
MPLSPLSMLKSSFSSFTVMLGLKDKEDTEEEGRRGHTLQGIIKEKSRLRTLLRRMAVNMLQISAWHVTSQWDSSSTMQPMLSASWMMKFISRSNSPPTSWRREREEEEEGDDGGGGGGGR